MEKPAIDLELSDSLKLKNFPKKDEFLDLLEKEGSSHQIEAYEKVCEISERISSAGGRSLIVGGSVRDYFFGKIAKDFDIEVYGLLPEDLETMLRTVGKTSEVGKSFGIIKVFADNGIDIDVSIPRRDSKVSEGHKGFAVNIDPHMSIEEAAKRRDFTFNTLAADPLTGEIFDSYGGIEDIRNKTLKVTDPELFRDDPLRVLRGLQFIGRFGLNVEENSKRIMSEMAPYLMELPKERILEEWKKLLLKSEKPSRALMAGIELGVWEQLHPEFLTLLATPQEPEWHPEGDVWTHTLMVVDEAAKIIKDHDLSPEAGLPIMLASLCHDLGKATTTYTDQRGRIVSPGHELAGKVPTEKFLDSLNVDSLTKEKVVALVADHMSPGSLYRAKQKGEPITAGAFKKLAKRISPATIEELVMVSESDSKGRGPFLDEDGNQKSLELYNIGQWLISESQKAGVYNETPVNVLRGKDLLSIGLKAGIEFGKIIDLGNRVKDLSERLAELDGNKEGVFDKQKLLDLISSIKDTKKAVEQLKITGIEIAHKIRTILKENRNSSKTI